MLLDSPCLVEGRLYLAYMTSRVHVSYLGLNLLCKAVINVQVDWWKCVVYSSCKVDLSCLDLDVTNGIRATFAAHAGRGRGHGVHGEYGS